MTQVLVVDDDRDIRRLLTLAFTRAGWTVRESQSGPAAIDALRDDPEIDMVVLDVQMPGMDGWEALRTIRSDPATVDVPVVISTVKARDDEVRVAWESGCDGFVAKPYTLDGITSEVERVLARGPDERRRHRERMLSRLTASG